MKSFQDMTKKELLEAKSKIDFWLTRKTTKKSDSIAINIDVFYHVVSTILLNKLRIKIPSLGIIIKQSLKAENRGIYNSLIETVRFLDTWLWRCLNRRPHREERIKTYTLYCKLMTDNMSDIGVPVSLKTLVNQHERWPGIFNINFPGYSESGLVNIALNVTELDTHDEEDYI